MRPDPTLSEMDDLIRRQREFFQEGKTRAISLRLEALERFEGAFQARQEEILDALAQDLGKPSIEAFLSEYYFVLQEVRLIRKRLRGWLRPRRVGSPLYFWPIRNRVQWEPHGHVLIVGPWNYPLQLVLAPFLGAVAAGNTVLLKPSEETPATAQVLASLMAEVFDPGFVSVVTGGAKFSASLLERKFDFVFFTGSTEVGRKVAEQIAPHLTPSVMELGGKCPCVVDESADLSITARRILIGKLFNAGQTCFAPDFVVVHRSVKGALVQELLELLRELPWEKEMASIINQKHYQRLKQLCGEETFQKGEDDLSQLHLAPRIFSETDWDASLMQAEIFGPLLPIVEYADRGELYQHLQSRAAPLALYCFTKDSAFIAELAEKVPSGGVTINDIGKHAMNLHLPFGGKGESGHGRYRGKDSVRAFSYERTYSKRFFLPDPFEILPPRGKQDAQMRKWMK